MRSKSATVFLLGFLLFSIASAQQISIESIYGTYQVKRSGETEFSDSSTNYLEQGDSLRTMTNSNVKISFLDGSYVIFGPSTEGVFDEILGDPETGLLAPFEITGGIARANKQNPGSLVRVITPHIVVNIDSDVIIDINNEETTVYVIEGSANIMELNLLPIFGLDQGQMLISDGGSITSPYPYDEDELDLMTSQFNQDPFAFVLPIDGSIDTSNPLFYIILIVIAILIILIIYKLTRKKSPY